MELLNCIDLFVSDAGFDDCAPWWRGDTIAILVWGTLRFHCWLHFCSYPTLKCRSTRLCKTITCGKSETFLIQSTCLNGVVLFLSLPNRWTFYHQVRLDHSGPQNWPTVQGKWPGSIAQCSILVAGGIDRKVGYEELACVVKQSKGHWIQLCELNCCTHFTTAVWLSTVLEQLLKGTPSEAAWACLKM